jgi:hypothetical protein
MMTMWDLLAQPHSVVFHDNRIKNILIMEDSDVKSYCE